MEPQDRIPTQRVGGSGSGAGALAALVAAALLVAVLKPWEAAAPLPAPPSPQSPPLARAAVSSGPTAALPARTPTATLEPELAAAQSRGQCHAPEWRLVTMERTRSRRTRTLFPVKPIPAAGPDDPSIVGHPLWATELLGIGVCVPRGDQDTVEHSLARLTIWQLRESGPPQPLSMLTPLDRGLYRLGEAYFGPPGSRGRTAAWPIGRYVFEIQPERDSEEPLWFALDYVGDGRPRGDPAR